MKNRILLLIIFAVLVFYSCNIESKSTNQLVYDTVINDETNIKTEQKAAEDTIKKLFDELKKIPVDKSLLVGEMKFKNLKYKSFELGDFAHFIFEDENGKEYDFGKNNTDFELTNNLPDEEINKKYLNKKFVVVWRSVQQKNPEKDDPFGAYTWSEILYLKLVNKQNPNPHQK